MGVVLVIAFVVLRVAHGAPIKLPWIGNTNELDDLRDAVEELNQDAKLKKNVLFTLRRRLAEAR
jgi:hypothetical protein